MDRMAIFARDDWNCHLCGVAVDYLADPISDLYPSLDHLTPQSKGGSHDLANLATAHRICNSIRRDRSVEEARLELVHG
jgi:5-methylcytosine-specific restriction endonuclease McrA